MGSFPLRLSADRSICAPMGEREPVGRFRDRDQRDNRSNDREVELATFAAAKRFLASGGSRASWLRLYDAAVNASLVAYKWSETREAS
jgi:hypothetical protein